MPTENPRLRGIREHLERAQFFLKLAEAEKDPESSFRIMMAAVYSCRAITELMLEAVDKEEVKNFNNHDIKPNRKNLESQLFSGLPYYRLLECIRIHDFHRFGIVPPDPNKQMMFVGGPIKLKTQKGTAAVTLTDRGIKESTSGNSKVQLQRPLCNQDGKFFDDNSCSYITLGDILKMFLAKIPEVISSFKKL